MNLLSLIWMSSIGMALFACAVLAALIAARLVRQRHEFGDPERHTRISKALLDYAVKNAAKPRLSLGKRMERLAVLETALDALPFLRAEPKERLVTLLREAGLDSRLRRQVRHGSVRDQIAAMEALVLFPDEKTLALLGDMERSKDLRIWLEALRTRTLLGAGPTLLGLLQYAERPGARRAPIMQDLVLARVKQDLGEALRALDEPLPILTRALLLKAIGDSKDLRALKALRAALSHEDGAVRTAAAEALGDLGADEAGPALAKAASDPDWRVRLKACEGIGERGLHRHRKALEPLLSDPVWWVRLRAEEALARLQETKEQSEAETRVAVRARTPRRRSRS